MIPIGIQDSRARYCQCDRFRLAWKDWGTWKDWGQVFTFDSLTTHFSDPLKSLPVNHGEIVVTTTTGKEIRVPASLEKFADELANSGQSNFVSITHPPSHNRFVDDGPDFLTIVESKSE